MRRAWGAAVLVLLLAGDLAAGPPRDPRLAQLPLPTGGSVDWHQWDSFFTNVVKKLAEDLPEAQRDQLRDLFLDSRYQLVQSLSLGSSDPVPSLLQDSWSRLSPILKQSVSSLPPQVSARYTGFISAMDGAASLTGLGQRFGLVQITPDMLRSASSLLGPSAGDPLAYVLDVDSGLRSFLGLGSELLAPRISPALGQAPARPLGLNGLGKASWFVAPAFAADDEFDRLNQWVPQTPELNDYLTEVRRLLGQSSAAALNKSRLAPQYQPLFRQIVLAAAWQETCWRQFVKKGEKLTPLASATGDVGLMQVN